MARGFQGMPGGNMQALARQAQKMQQKMMEMQAELEAREYEATAGGGVVANGYLRSRLQEECAKRGYTLVLPEKRYCTDNAAMIASEGLIQFRQGNFASLDLNAKASIPLSATLKKGGQ